MSFESKPKFDIMPANESTDFSTVAYSGLRPNRPQQPLLILLSGATCGGKSTLADRLQQIWPHSQRIGQDDFFREEDDPEHVWLTLSDGKRHQDWEHVRSIDWNKMRQVAHDRLQLARSSKLFSRSFFRFAHHLASVDAQNFDAVLNLQSWTSKRSPTYRPF